MIEREHLPRYAAGTPVVDCGRNGRVVDVRDGVEDDELVYDVEFEDDQVVPYPDTELELGIVDGTIRVGAP